MEVNDDISLDPCNDSDNQSAIKIYAHQTSELKNLELSKKNEDSTLRRSLRESKKLRALGKEKIINKVLASTIKPEENLGYEADDCEIKDPSNNEMLDLLIQLRKKMQLTDKAHTTSEAQQLSDEEWDWLAKTVSNKSVQNAFNLHDIVGKSLEICRTNQDFRPQNTWPISNNSEKALCKVLSELQKCTESTHLPEINKLLALLSNSKLKGLLSAHDGLARVWQKSEMSSVLKKKQANQQIVYSSPVPGCFKVLAVDENGETITTSDGQTLINVTIQKTNNDYLGATIKAEGSSIFIGRIISGGLIEKTGLLNEGDELISVNSIILNGKDFEYVSSILNRLEGRIKFLVAPSMPITQSLLYDTRPIVHLRSLFSYEPSNDFYNPCKEASLVFDKGDILRVLTTRDPNWWQAYRIDAEGVVNGLAGLIPSPFFHRQRSLIRLQEMGDASYSSDDNVSEESDESTDMDTDFTGSMLNSSLGYNLSDVVAHSYASRMSGMTTTAEQLDNVSTLSAADPVWSLHGYGPRQMLNRKRNRKKKQKKIISSLLSGSIFGKKKNNFSPTKHNYYPPMSPGAVNWADGDQINWMLAEAKSDLVKRPSLLTYEPVELYYPQPQRRRPLVLVGPVHVGRQKLIDRLVQGDSDRFALPDIHTTNSTIKSTAIQRYQCISKEDFLLCQHKREFVEWGAFNHHYYGTKHSSIEAIVRVGKVGVIALRPDSIRAIRKIPFLPFIIFVSPPDTLPKLRKLTEHLGETKLCSDEELTACIEQNKKMERRYGHFFEFVLVPEKIETDVQNLRKIALDLERTPQWVPVHWLRLAEEVAIRAAETARHQSAH